MCTAISYKTKDHYFGRTLDYERSFGEEVVICPRKYPLGFRYEKGIDEHYAIIGMAHVEDSYPLYYDAANEKGLCIAGLNFSESTRYASALSESKVNILQFELIPWLLGRCSSADEAADELEKINLLGEAYNEVLPTARLHWLIADRERAFTVESVEDGIKIYENPVGVLTNEPPFPVQLFGLNDYMALSSKPPKNQFSPSLDLSPYSRGMGAIGLPGDLSSRSRFVRAAFARGNSVSEEGEAESVGQLFHILGSVEQVRGLCEVSDGEYEMTVYTSCVNADKGIYYYTTYTNRQITAVDMRREDISTDHLSRFPLVTEEQISYQNTRLL